MNVEVYVQVVVLSTYLFVMVFSFFSIVNNKPFRKVVFNAVIIYTLLVISSYLVYCRYTLPILNIKGNENITIKISEDYFDEGYEIIHPNKELKSNVVVRNYVDKNKVGTYDINYTINYYGKKISKNRKVKVIDTEKPIIELKGLKEITISQGIDYKEPGYSAIDNYDGDITNKVKVTNNIKDKVGTYEVIYTVEDSSGNSYSINRKVTRVDDNDGVIYLTFDDGPSSTTSKVLDVLKRQNVKATFFVVNYGNYYEDVVKRIVNEGHTIAIHSYTHNYKLIYSSEDAYFDDLYKIRDKVKNTTGIDTNIMRFPGGSSNTISSFNKGIMSRLVKLVKNDGFHYFDWNVDSSDAGVAKNSTQVYNNVMKGLRINRNNVVLMHDFGNNQKTVDALENIIIDAKNKGYSFSKITNNTQMIVHGVNN